MASDSLKGLRVAILVSDDFEQVELTSPREALQNAGADVFIVSPVPDQIQGMHHDQKADTFKVDIPLDQAEPKTFDALMLPGGALNADQLRMNPKAQEFVKYFDQQNRPIAFICHAPWTLVSAGIVKGRNLTSWSTIQDDIRNAGGIWHDEQVVRDKNWVSSRGPQDLRAFNEAMVQLFQEMGKKSLQTAGTF